jgi:iron complex transport system ATP-binding protein
VAIEVRAGEIVGLVGPNGSGKSTLIRLLSGVLSGYSGAARIDGREVSGIARLSLARTIAVVPQEPVFTFPFTALEIVLLGRHPHLAGSTFEAETDIALARDALRRCGAAELASRRLQDLSSGERQRVVFAKALAQGAPLLLLDEPASFLDIRHQVALYDLVRSLAREGHTVLTALHDLNLAAEYCDRVYLLREGRIEASGPPEAAFSSADLARVFGCEVHVDRNSRTGKRIVLPLPARVRVP